MATIHRFEDLEVWQASRLLSDQIYWLTQKGTFSRDFELRNQINGASGSIMDNIAEGFGRGSRAEYVQFLGFSMGSCTEVKSQLYRSLDRQHLNQLQFDELYAQADKIGKMLGRFIEYLNRTEYKGVKFKRSEP